MPSSHYLEDWHVLSATGFARACHAEPGISVTFQGGTSSEWLCFAFLLHARVQLQATHPIDHPYLVWN